MHCGLNFAVVAFKAFLPKKEAYLDISNQIGRFQNRLCSLYFLFLCMFQKKIFDIMNRECFVLMESEAFVFHL